MAASPESITPELSVSFLFVVMDSGLRPFGRPRNDGVFADEPYGFIPAGATCELFIPTSSKAWRTSPEALASSTNAVT
jgi:hypothetical protein